MCGIGDALYHLELWGLRLVHVQQAVDELDFGVKCLQEDMRWEWCAALVWMVMICRLRICSAGLVQQKCKCW